MNTHAPAYPENQIEIEQSVYDQFATVAEQRGMTVDALAQKLLEDHLYSCPDKFESDRQAMNTQDPICIETEIDALTHGKLTLLAQRDGMTADELGTKILKEFIASKSKQLKAGRTDRDIRKLAKLARKTLKESKHDSDSWGLDLRRLNEQEEALVSEYAKRCRVSPGVILGMAFDACGEKPPYQDKDNLAMYLPFISLASSALTHGETEAIELAPEDYQTILKACFERGTTFPEIAKQAMEAYAANLRK